MSAYVHGSRMSYRDYLQAKKFVDDVRWDISQANLNLLATQQTLQRFGVKLSTEIETTNRTLAEANRTIEQGFGRVQEGLERGFGEVAGRLEEVDRTLVQGFVTLHSDLMSVEASVQDLSAKFEWGFSELMVSLGSANESLAALVRLARTPEQTWAFEQYEIARDAFRRGLFREALDYVERAIGGYQGHTGYSIEHRFHSLLGVIRLGSHKNNSPDIVDEPKAYDAFQRAARYAMSGYREDAARALCGAAQAAYCLGRFDAAETHASEALRLNPKLPEAGFSLAKTLMHVDDVTRALPALAHAIKLDPLYCLKAFDDGDFTKHEAAVRRLVEDLRDQLVQESHHDLQETNEVVVRSSRLIEAAKGIFADFGRTFSVGVPETIGSATALQGVTAGTASIHRALSNKTYLGAVEATDMQGVLRGNAREVLAGALAGIGASQKSMNSAIGSGAPAQPSLVAEKTIENRAEALRMVATLIMGLLVLLQTCSSSTTASKTADAVFGAVVFGIPLAFLVGYAASWAYTAFKRRQNNVLLRRWEESVHRRTEEMLSAASTATERTNALAVELRGCLDRLGRKAFGLARPQSASAG